MNTTLSTLLDGPKKPASPQAVLVILAVAETIREARTVPSGHLYAMLMDRLTIDGYRSIIATLKGAGLVSESSNLLTWIGPEIKNNERKAQ